MNPAIAGYWYMGTMSGEDANLVVNQDGTLRVRFGGCFSSGPWIDSPFKVDGQKLLLLNPVLRRKLGKYLKIETYKNNYLLVPEVNEADVAENGLRYYRCFWKNLLGEKGLELPPESKDFEPRSESQPR